MKHYYETKIYLWLRNLFFRYIGIPYVYHKTSKYNILNSMDSIQYIIDNHCSVSRYGDGEFSVMWGGGNGFQFPNERLAKALIEVLSSDLTNHINAIPLTLKDLSNLRDYPYFFWSHYTGRSYWRLRKYLSFNKKYLNSLFTRFYMDYVDKSNCEKQFKLIKSIWNNKDIVIVEGNQTRSGIGNDLYDNAKSIKRILGPAKNAIDKYDEMLNAIKNHVDKEQLILLSYGMTATVLAYDLANLGYWAIDLGHIDLEYEWFLRNAKNKETIDGKFTNEVNNGDKVAECTDPLYLTQIIVDITK